MNDVLIRCEHIHKSYLLGRTSLPVLRGVDFGMRRGRFVAITGASGSGKSTLLHVMSGLDVPQRGQVYYRGLPMFEAEGLRKIPQGREGGFADAVVEGTPRGRGGRAAGGPSRVRLATGGVGTAVGSGADRMLEARRNGLLNVEFGFVFQFYHLLPEFDVLENVLLPRMVGRSIGGWLAEREAGSSRAHELLDRVGLRDRLRHRPNELSGGERQRVAIARALINEPAVLFADEPTGNLDSSSGRSIFLLLKELNAAGQTIMMVTHDRGLAEQADEVVHLADGRIE